MKTRLLLTLVAALSAQSAFALSASYEDNSTQYPVDAIESIAGQPNFIRKLRSENVAGNPNFIRKLRKEQVAGTPNFIRKLRNS